MGWPNRGRREVAPFQSRRRSRSKFVLRIVRGTACRWHFWVLEARHQTNVVRAQRQLIASRVAMCQKAMAGRGQETKGRDRRTAKEGAESRCMDIESLTTCSDSPPLPVSKRGQSFRHLARVSPFIG